MGVTAYLVTMLVSNFTAAAYLYFFVYLGLAVAVGHFGAMARERPADQYAVSATNDHVVSATPLPLSL